MSIKGSFNKLSKSWGLSGPATLASIAYLTLAAVILLPLDIGDVDDQQKQQQYNLSRRLWILVLMLLPIGLSIYSINCMVVGRCRTWSWVQSLVLFIYTILFTTISVVSWAKPGSVHHSDDTTIIPTIGW